MDSLPFPSWPFLLIQAGNYLLTLICLRHAWRQERYLAFIILAAMVFGFVVEYSQVTKIPQPYHYTQAIVSLPGPVPLGICLSWGIIFYAVMQTSRWLGLSGTVRPLLSGFLAVSIDFVLDPTFIAMKFWVWEQPGPWFGVPWDNYVGWFVIIASFTVMLELGYRWIPPGSKGWLGDLLVAFGAIVPAFLTFVGIMLGYLWLIARIPEPLVVALFFGICGVIVLRKLPGARRDHPLDRVVLAVPFYLYACALVALFGSGLYREQSVLIIVAPTIILLGVLGYLRPYAIGRGSAASY